MAAASSAVPPIGGQVPTAGLKAPPTSSTTPESVTSTASGPSGPPRVTSPVQPPRRATRPVSSDFLSDKATAALIRRTLCAQHLADRGKSTPAPIEALLPPLTSRNDVDSQLYALISIIIREFVQNWYAKITPDETFVAEIVQIIAHCTRALEQRLRKVDLESLLLDELPELFDAHIRAYRIAKNSPARPPVEASTREIYHSLNPLPALYPVPTPGDERSIQAQEDHESIYRQLLVQGVLALLLPTEDLENGCLTALVGQLFSELIIGNLVAKKLSEPWLIWEILILLTRQIRTRMGSGSDFAEVRAVPNESVYSAAPRSTSKRSWSIHHAFWTVVQWGFLLLSLARVIIGTVLLSRTLPPRSSPVFTRPVDSSTYKDEGTPNHPWAKYETRSSPVKAPIVDFSIWPCLGNLLEMDARMPWLGGALSMIQWGAMRGPGELAGFDGTIDRLLSHYIHVYILDPSRLPPLLRAIRGALFPNNAPGAPSLVPPSSDEQLAALRRRCASALLALVPKGVGRLYYGSNTTWSWSSIIAASSTNNKTRNANWRSGPLNNASSGSSSSSHNAAPSPNNDNKNATSSTGGEVPRVRVTDEGKPAATTGHNQDNQINHATLTPTPPPAPGTSPSCSSKRQFGFVGVGGTGEPPSSASAAAGGDNNRSATAADMCDEEDEDENRILAEIETDILDVFSDPYCNKHLVYGILELVLVRLMPELAEKGVIELWEERLS